MRALFVALAGAVAGALAASGVWALLLERSLAQVHVPVLSRPAGEVDWHEVRSVTQTFSSWTGWQVASSGEWAVGEAVPLRVEAGAWLVDVELGGTTAPAFVDTGAETGLCSWEMLGRLAVPERLPVSVDQGGVVGLVAAGGPRLWMADRVRLGPHTLGDVLFSAMPLASGAAGLGLGWSTFQAVVLDLDGAAGVLRINPTDAPEGVPFEGSDRLPVVTARVGGHEVHVLIDTGASHTTLTPALVAALGLPPVPGVRAVTRDVHGAEQVGGMVDLPALTVAGGSWSDLRAAVGAVGWAEASGWEMAINLGTDALAGHRVVVDYPGRTAALR